MIKKICNLILELISNKFFVLLLIFTFYTYLNFFLNQSSLLFIFRELIQKLILLFLGFIAIRELKGKKMIAIGILLAGLLCTGDLIFSHIVFGQLYIVPIINYIRGDYSLLNYNFYASGCGVALIITTILFVNKELKKITSFILLIIFALGILISTSRMTLLAVAVTLVLIPLTRKELNINFRKLFSFGIVGTIIIVMVALSYSFILSEMNISTEVADKIYFRLVQEPLSFFQKEPEEFGWDNNKVKGTARWRMSHTFRDIDVFLVQKNSVIFFGYGKGGYSKIGLVQFQKNKRWQYSSHNFYTNLVSEIGIVGLFLFLLFFIPLLYSAAKNLKKGVLHFSLVFILFYLFLYTFGGNPDLTDNFSYIMFGIVISELVEISHLVGSQKRFSNLLESDLNFNN